MSAGNSGWQVDGDRRFYLEWLVLACLSVVLLVWLSRAAVVPALGQVAYDTLHRLSPAEPESDIVVVAIDDASLKQLGGWPLSRRVYADLLRQLADTHNEPLSIGFDVLFLDPRPEDVELAAQIRRHRVVLPVELPEQGNTRLLHQPVAPYPSAAHALAHIQVSFESDGVLRGLHLQEQGVPHLVVAMGGRLPALAPEASIYRRFRLPSPAKGFKTIALADLLTGRALLSELKDKYVLIGATAPSLGDHYPTVHAGRMSSGTPGVTLHAGALHALLHDELIEEIDGRWQLALGLLAVALVLGSLLVWGPLAQMLWAATVLLALLLLSRVLLVSVNSWFDPGPAWLTIALLKPAWAWRRTSMVVHFLEARAQALEAVTRPLPKLQRSGPLGRQTSDAVMRYSHVLDDALEVVKQQLSSLSAIVRGAPNAMLVLDAQGQITLFNQRLQDWLPAGLVHEGASIEPVLRYLGCTEGQSLSSLIGQDHFVMTPGAGAGAGQRHFVLNVIALSPDAGQHMHLLSLLDISDMRALQVQRERTLELLSHDMRTPVASILSLAQERAVESAEKIQRHARTLLEMMDDFILSIQAKEQHYALAETLFDDVLDEAIYQVRDLARQRGMAINWQESEAGLFVRAVPRLLIRVLANVLVNAIRHGEAGSTIEVQLDVLHASAQSCLRCTVRNRVGLPEAASAGMAHKGFGLGMGFVEEVMLKHHGQVVFDVRRAPGAHAQVWLTLPIAGESLG